MTRRWIVALAALAVALAAGAVAAALRYLIPQLDPPMFDYNDTAQQDAINAYYQWINSGYPYVQLVPWLALAALLAGIAALALAAYRARGRTAQAGSASATASRDASSAASVSAGSAESIS